jgi:hypothetical protein
MPRATGKWSAGLRSGVLQNSRGSAEHRLGQFHYKAESFCFLNMPSWCSALLFQLFGRAINSQLPVIVTPTERFHRAHQVPETKPRERRADVMLRLRVE